MMIFGIEYKFWWLVLFIIAFCFVPFLYFWKTQDKWQREADDEMPRRLEKLERMTAVQCTDGNWNRDPYFWGLTNGLLLSVACMKDEEPQYLTAPEKWLSRFQFEPTTGEQQ